MVTLDVETIEEELAKREVPVAELCRRAGMAQSTWQRWKNGHFEPRASTARRIDRALSEIRGETKPSHRKHENSRKESAA